MKHPTASSRLILWVEKYLAWFLLSILKYTYRYQVHGNSCPQSKVIYIFWHQNLLSILLNAPQKKIRVMISNSFDGELIAGPTELFGSKAIRGSSTRGGFAALKEMVRHAQNHSLALTPDGPRGPAFKIKEGVAYMAFLSGLPIVPVVFDIQHKWQFNSWDRFIVPKPFTRIDMHYLEPVFVNNREELDAVCAQLETMMRVTDVSA